MHSGIGCNLYYKKHLQKCHPMDYIKKILEVEEEEKQKAIQKVLKLNIYIYSSSLSDDPPVKK